MNPSHNLVIVDYGSGNLRSVWHAATRAAEGSSWNIKLSNNPQEVAVADRLILPGQGAMADCMQHLRGSALLEPVLKAVEKHRPLLGICIGMQMLLDCSEEANTPTLSLIAGQVKRFELEGLAQADGSRYKTPQMGWNQVWQTAEHAHHPMWQGIPDGSYFYFVHSYYAQPQQKSNIAGLTDYGERFASALAKDNLFATQFHPEKSADCGLRLFRNFLDWQP